MNQITDVSCPGRPYAAAGLLVATLVALGGTPTMSQEQARLIEDEPASPSAGAAFELLIEDGGRLDWSRQRQTIAYDAPDRDGLYDLWLWDVPSGGRRCLTCEMYDFRKAHVLSPTWHPSGDFLVVQVQRRAGKLDTTTLDLFGPDRGPHSDLWLIRRDGKGIWQLTRNADQGSAVLDPSFSWEGDRVAWAERTLSRRGGRFGSWRVRSAELRFRRGVPKLDRERTHPGPIDEALVLVGSWAPDDRALLVAANWSEGQPPSALDLYRLDLEGKDDETRRLPFSRVGSSNAPHASPVSEQVAWSSSAAVRGRPVAGRVAASEVWLSSSSGTGRQRLSRFNDPLADEYLGAAAAGDLAWSPDGRQIAVQVIYGTDDVRGGIALLSVPVDAAASAEP